MRGCFLLSFSYFACLTFATWIHHVYPSAPLSSVFNIYFCFAYQEKKKKKKKKKEGATPVRLALFNIISVCLILFYFKNLVFYVGTIH